VIWIQRVHTFDSERFVVWGFGWKKYAYWIQLVNVFDSNAVATTASKLSGKWLDIRFAPYMYRNIVQIADYQ